MGWNCHVCQRSNQEEFKVCPECGTRRPILQSAPPAKQSMPVYGSDQIHSSWSCSRCTFINKGAGTKCEMCYEDRSDYHAPTYQHTAPSFEQHSMPPAPNPGWSPAVSPDSERRVVVLGRTGSGKSTTCNNILDKNVFRSDSSSQSVTTHCQRETCDRFGRNIQLIDTPGLFDTGMSNADITREIVKCVGMTAPGPHAFLMVLRIDRFTKEEQDTVEHFKNVFGPGMMRHLIVLFTRKDDLIHDGKTIHQFIQSVPPMLKDLIQACGNRYLAFNNRGTPAEKRRDVQELVHLIDDIVMNNGGQCYTTEMYREAEKAMKKREEQLKKEHEAKANREKMKIQREFEEKMKVMERQQNEKISRLMDEVKRKEQEKENSHEMEKMKLEIEKEKLKMEKELELERRRVENEARKKQKEIDDYQPNHRERARKEVNEGQEQVLGVLKFVGDLFLPHLLNWGIKQIFPGWAEKPNLITSEKRKETKANPTDEEKLKTDEGKRSKESSVD